MKEALKTLLKRIYRFSFSPFFKNGIHKKIGDAGTFRIDCFFAFNDFSSLGTKHNSGFAKWLEACRGKRIIFDIGAHIGLYSIPASFTAGNESYIYAFEPSDANRRYLEKHVRFNDVRNIKVFPYMVGSVSCANAEFNENRDVDAMDSIAIVKSRDCYNKVFKRQVSLDDFCVKENGIPEVIKIDVEGAELNVLRGALGLLKRHNPLVFLSAHPKRLKVIGQSPDELMNFIRGLGYAVYNPDGQRAYELGFNEYILIPERKGFNEVF